MLFRSLLDTNPDPSREEAAFAIRNNICRCTGYVKIIDGILLAAKCFREVREARYGLSARGQDRRYRRGQTNENSVKHSRGSSVRGREESP